MAATKLISVLNMYCPEDRRYRGKTKTDDGQPANGYFVRQLSATEHLLVYSNGNLTRRYVYPRVDRKFSNPMVNMYNLNFVGGWHFKNENGNLIGVNHVHLVQRVIAGLKPMAWLGAFKCHVDHVRKFHEAIELAKESGLAVREFERQTDLLGAVACRRGRIADMFDLDILLEDYAQFAEKDGVLYAKIRTAINSLRNSNMEDYMGLSEENEEDTKHFILTGLFLGFPIESTYSLIS
jgi:hypothetical protein